MQGDMFGEISDDAGKDSSPPVLAGNGAWATPESVAFDAALHRGDLRDALAIIYRLKDRAAVALLLQSGFTIGAPKRPKLLADVQSDIVAASRLRMNGYELRAMRSKLAVEQEQDNPPGSKLPPTDIRIGDGVRKDGLDYVVSGAISGGVAAERVISNSGGIEHKQTIFLLGDDAITAKLAYDKAIVSPLFVPPDPKTGAVQPSPVEIAADEVELVAITRDDAANFTASMHVRVFDTSGKEYEAFSARHDYLQVFPIGPENKPVVFAGNSTYFHLNPNTASAYPDRRSDPIYQKLKKSLAKTAEVAHSLIIDNAVNSASEKENDYGSDNGIDSSVGTEPESAVESRDLSGVGRPDSGDGYASQADSEPVVSGLAARGDGVASIGPLSGLPEVTTGTGSRYPGRTRAGNEALEQGGNHEGIQDQSGTASVGLTGDQRAAKAVARNGEWGVVDQDGQFWRYPNQQEAERVAKASPVLDASGAPVIDQKSELNDKTARAWVHAGYPLDKIVTDSHGWYRWNVPESDLELIAVDKNSNQPLANIMRLAQFPNGKWVATHTAFGKNGGITSSPSVFDTQYETRQAAIDSAVEGAVRSLKVDQDDALIRRWNAHKVPDLFQAQKAVGIVEDIDRSALRSEVSGWIEKDKEAGKQRLLRLQSKFKNHEGALSEKLGIQANVNVAVASLRKIRLQVFDVEDAAIQAVVERNAGLFRGFAENFPRTNDALGAAIEKETHRVAAAEDHKEPAALSAGTPSASLAVGEAEDAAAVAHSIASDPFLGREFNTVHGRAKVTQITHPGEDVDSTMYQFTTEAGLSFREYGKNLEARIAKLEFDATPHGIAATKARTVAYEANQIALQSRAANGLEKKQATEAKLDGFFAQAKYQPISAGQCKKALLTTTRFENRVMSAFEFVDELVGRKLELRTEQEDKIKPLSRMAFFRATNEEQRAHERKIAEAGKRTVYYVGDFQVGAFEFAYASYRQKELANSVDIGDGGNAGVPVPGVVFVGRKLGDFFEIEGESAKEAARVLDLTLTRRNEVPMVGWPYHAHERMVAELLRNGIEFALAELGTPVLGSLVSETTVAASVASLPASAQSASDLRVGDGVRFTDHVGGGFHPGDQASVLAVNMNGVLFAYAKGGTSWLSKAMLNEGDPAQRWTISHKVAAVDPAELGRAAFASGIKSAPALDPAMKAVLKGLGTKETIKALDAWNKGWHTANLAAPVEYSVGPAVGEASTAGGAVPILGSMVAGDDTLAFDAAAMEKVAVDQSYRVAVVNRYGEMVRAARPDLPSGSNQLVARLTDGLLNKDVDAISFIANGLNDIGKKVFTEFTGVALPRGQGASLDVIRAWCNDKNAKLKPLVAMVDTALAVPTSKEDEVASPEAQASLAGNSSSEVARSEYPFGPTRIDDQFFGSHVRVHPTLKGDVAWEGTVSQVLNGGRLVSVRRDAGEREFNLPIRISGDRLEVLETVDRSKLVEVGDPEYAKYFPEKSVDASPVVAGVQPGPVLASMATDPATSQAQGVLDAATTAPQPFVASNLNANTRAERMAAQVGMFDPELKAEYDAIALRERTRQQAARNRVALTRAKMDGDTSAWDKTEFAPRIHAMLDSLANAGEKGMEMRAVIQAGINMDANQGRLTEDSVAFREKVTQRELATLAQGDVRLSVTPQVITAAGLAETEPDIGKLPSAIVDAAVHRLNELGASLGKLGFTHYYEVDSRAPKDAIALAKEMREITGSMLMLAPIRERIAKGYKTAKQSKLDSAEDFATEAIGINTRNYPSIVLDKNGVVVTAGKPSQLPVEPQQTQAMQKEPVLGSRGDLSGVSADVPESVLRQVGWALTRLRDVESALDGVQKARGNGHILALELQDQQPKTVRAYQELSNFRRLAEEIGIDPETVIQELGGVPDFTRFAESLVSQDQTSVASAASAASVQAESVTTSLSDVVSTQAAPLDHVITEDDQIGVGGLSKKFDDNYRAITIVRTLESEKRHAVGDEMNALARYVGWGGLKGVFDANNKQWAKQHVALRALLTDQEWDAARRSVLDAFYTSPVVVESMYDAVQHLGFEHGRILEPSVGVGNFFGMMPETIRKRSVLHGVELDVLTSQIVSALYPSAHIAKGIGFQALATPSGYFDMVTGNCPFGSEAVVDNKGSVYSGWSIHNYFFAKSIEMLRPGGIMPMVVSHNFLDKLDPHVRQWIARRAELVSGVRLPNTAFKENANTEVVTDILIFRRLDFENTLGKQENPIWLNTEEVPIEDKKTGESQLYSVNEYFVKNPQNVLGVNSATGTMYRGNEYTVEPNGVLKDQLAQWVQSLPKGIYEPLVRVEEALDATAQVQAPDHVKEGSFFIEGALIYQRLDDRYGEKRSQQWQAPNKTATARMSGMIELRDSLRQQISLEKSNSPGSDIEDSRKRLNSKYDEFTKSYGFLNDPVNKRLFDDDTESSLLQALEFDYEKALSLARAEEYGVEQRPSRCKKADIFAKRVLFPPGEVQIVESAKDALLHSLNLMGGVDMEYMQSAYPKSSDEIIEELGDLLFVDPVRGLVTRDEYLSGDVKTKLTEAQRAAVSNAGMKTNVETLTSIIPADKLPSEIHAAIGAAWIPNKVFSDFAREISGQDLKFNYVKASGHWMKSGESVRPSTKLSSEFGTDSMNSVDILVHMMNSRAPEVKKRVEDENGNPKYVTDEAKTEAVSQRVDKIRGHWDSWLWKAEDRTDELVKIYNDRFNRSVERKYDGSHLTLPGMSLGVTLLSHQKNGVWRGLQDRSMLADQVVGAGKTFEGVAMLMEMRRLGIAKKPLVVVPNHLTLQWRSDFYKLYPGANVLAATPSDFGKDNRERLFSKIVTGNWDAVIIGHSSLKKLSVPIEAETKIIKEQRDDIAKAIEKIKQERGDRGMVRDMEKIKANLDAKISKLLDKAKGKDKVVDFSDLGVDALFVDEMHEFKNLFFTTQMNRVAGLGNPAGSGKAFDMFVKIRWLRETFGDQTPIITATGTPISNSLAEMFTMQRFMQYDKLKENDIHIFDAWAKQYGDVQNVYEVAPSGTGYRLSQRFAKFKNLASLMNEYRSFADVITLDDLKAQEIAQGKTFPVPKINGGRPQNIVAERSELQERFFGIPELVRDEVTGQIEFEIDLSHPSQIVEFKNGKYVLQQKITRDDGDVVESHSSNFYDTPEEAALMTAIKAVTPVMTIDPNSIIGQFDNLAQLTRKTKGKINALSLTSLANKAGLDYRIIAPSAPDFEDSKINIAVRNIVSTHEKWEADKGTQLVFCDLSVPISAKAKMASKEKRVYVRDPNGMVVHKKGTLHTPKDFDGFPYFVVPVTAAKDKTFSIYDPATGQVLKEGMDSRQDAHHFILIILTQEGGPERLLALRERSPSIEHEEIEDYKNDHAIDSDGDAGDLEFSLEDIEAATGVAGFSVYDDMKAKLIGQGIPANQIEFIHDHDTPVAKQLLFKRVNAGEVRILFGSTPKMGAGTNVQERLVALHHIDAPWRPSDLEQREGRIIRRGNELYARDPENFTIEVNRYATSQTYDTRRWQLLEHKAAGLQQLRNYSGANELEDVSTEASNSADMKAAASGNPLILKETQLANEVKKLKLLERAHNDSDYLLRSQINGATYIVEQAGPRELANLRALIRDRDRATVLGVYQKDALNDKDDVVKALGHVHANIDALGSSRSLTYRGLKFDYSRTVAGEYRMDAPTGRHATMTNFSPTGVSTRMENVCNSLEVEVSVTENWIAQSQFELVQRQARLGLPFDKVDDLSRAISEHGKVQRALMSANSMTAVNPADMDEFKALVVLQKEKLRAFGFGTAIDEMEQGAAIDAVDAVGAALDDVSPVLTSLVDKTDAAGEVMVGENNEDLTNKAGSFVDIQGAVKQAADAFFDGLAPKLKEELLAPAITLRGGPTVSRKEYVDGFFQDGYLKAEYYADPKGSHVGFVVRDVDGKKTTLDSKSMYYADRVLMEANRALRLHAKAQTPVSVGLDGGAVLQPGDRVQAASVAVVGGKVKDMELYIKVAANSIAELRKTDVYRVLVESNRPVHQADIAAFIKQERPDLVGEVDDILREVEQEKAAVRTTPSDKLDGLASGTVLTSLADAAPLRLVGVTAPSMLPEVASFKTRIVESLPPGIPENWITFNAPRPILGHKYFEGEFECGRFYAAIDPQDSMASKFIAENEKLDARLLVPVPKDTQVALALRGNEYRDRYIEMEPAERFELLWPQITKLRDMPYGDLINAIVATKNVVREGVFSGTVLSVEHGVLTQKVDRDGNTVCHENAKLSSQFAKGDVINIKYSDGIGLVTSKQRSNELSR